MDGNEIYKDYKKLAQAMGVEDKDIPEPENDQPDDVAEVEEVQY